MHAKKTLIFLHGGPGYEDYLESYFKEEFPSDVECVFYSQSGGDSTDLSDLLKELDALVRQNASSYLVGHSWGGVLAQKYLEAFPERNVEGLILISSFLDHDKLQDSFKEATAKAGMDHPTLSKVFYTEEENRAGNEIKQKVRHFDKAFFKKIHHEFLDDFHGEEFFRKLKVPILNIYGSEDLRTPPELMKDLKKVNPKVRSVEIPNAGHFPFILPSRRKLVARAIMDFMS